MDMISRQAAIEALRVAYWNDKIQSAKDNPCIVDAMTDWAIRQVKALPSAHPEFDSGLYVDGFNDGYKQGKIDAQPEIIRCKDCKYRYIENEIWTCPFGLAGGPDFYCGYGAERRTDEQPHQQAGGD